MSDSLSREDMMSIPAREVTDPSELASNPIVSVIMLAYNHEPYIAQAIEGVVMQQCSFPIELLIGEDCSTDRTRDICMEYQQRYPQLIRLVTSDTNVGMHKNMFRLFGRLKGRYIAMCEGDDYWTAPEKLQRQVAFLDTHQEYSLCFHDAEVRYETPTSAVFHFPNHNLKRIRISDVIEKTWFIPTCSTVFRSSVRNQLPKRFQEFPVGDMPLWILLASQGEVFDIRKTMAVYRRHKGGDTAKQHSDPRHAISSYLQFIDMLSILNEALNWQYEDSFRRRQKYMRGLVQYTRIKHGLPQSIADHAAGTAFFLRHTIPRRLGAFLLACQRNHRHSIIQ